MDPAEAVAQILRELTKGQYLILTEAIKQAGGEVRINWDTLMAALGQPSPGISVDAEDGPIILRTTV